MILGDAVSSNHDALSISTRKALKEPALVCQVREEQAQLRPDPTATITGEVLNQMTYSRQVVKEVLRYRPPAPMVPQVRRQLYTEEMSFS